MKNYIKKGFIVNDIKNFVFGPAKAPVYGFGRNRKQKFVLSFTIVQQTEQVQLEFVPKRHKFY